jgi:hypothetical protein
MHERLAVAHPGLIGYSLLHINHSAGLGNDCLIRIEFYLYKLDVVAENLVINFM